VLYSKCTIDEEGIAMMTLKFALITMIAGSSVLPIHMDKIDIPVEQPRAQIEVINKEVPTAIVVQKEEVAPAASPAAIIPVVPVAPIFPVSTIEKASPAETVAPAEKNEISMGINQDKTYEQCMKEAFERAYAEVNRLLDQIPEQTDEQFQLRRMMQ
jgi:hypothetical protein